MIQEVTQNSEGIQKVCNLKAGNTFTAWKLNLIIFIAHITVRERFFCAHSQSQVASTALSSGVTPKVINSGARRTSAASMAGLSADPEPVANFFSVPTGTVSIRVFGKASQTVVRKLLHNCVCAVELLN